ncbi:class I SAM-dependent methyltransferase [Candidatus Bathyarchaeota archaeon]|nr:MAG: class I SAM-dependent methyltransferase [Candidatus Bathyarchaeota archaeon]
MLQIMVKEEISKNPREMVKEGYNKIATQYRALRARDSEDVRLLQQLVERLPKGARVLDAGCGSGIPVTRILARYFDVIGVDISEKQIQLARKSVPKEKFIRGDFTNLDFPDESFDAICSYYAIFHVPRSEHKGILLNFYRMLKPKGLALLCLGAGDLPHDIADYHGIQMFWSHYGREKNLRLLRECGYEIIWSKIVKDPIYPKSAHLFVLGEKLV